MTTEKDSVLTSIREAKLPAAIRGHDFMDLERFAENTRHMIVFDVISWDCPVGDKGERIRIFLSNEGYQDALQSQERGEMKIIKHARVNKGHLHFDVPEHGGR